MPFTRSHVFCAGRRDSPPFQGPEERSHLGHRRLLSLRDPANIVALTIFSPCCIERVLHGEQKRMASPRGEAVRQVRQFSQFNGRIQARG